MMRKITYTEIAKLRESSYYPLIFVGYPFERSNCFLRAEIAKRKNAYVVDLTGRLLDKSFRRLYGTDITFEIARDRVSEELKPYIYNKNFGSIELVDLGNVDCNKKNSYVMNALLNPPKVPIYILGIEQMNLQMICCFSILAMKGYEIHCSVSKLELKSSMEKMMMQAIFADMIIAGKANIEKICKSFECNGTAFYCHNGELNYEICSNKYRPIRGKRIQEKTYVLDADTIVSNPGSIISYGSNEVVIPAAVLDELDSPAWGREGKAALGKVVEILDNLHGNLREGFNTIDNGIIRIMFSNETIPMDYCKENKNNLVLSTVKAAYGVLVTENPALILKAETLGISVQTPKKVRKEAAGGDKVLDYKE